MLQGNQFHLKFHEFSAIAENPQGHTTLSLRHCMFTLMHSLFFFFFPSLHLKSSHTRQLICGYLIA